MVDIFAPQISTISKDLSGKTILIYGTNRTGKTKQATKLPKPCYLAFENGINGIAGVPFFPMRTWSDFVQFVKQVTKEKNLAQAKEMYQTIILDEASIMGDLCSEYVCEKYEVQRISEGNRGYGLWKEYSSEFEKQLRLLTSVGFTVVFIAHETTREFLEENGEKYSKIYPAGDKRIIDPICDLVDIISYAVVNGIDESGNEIHSSLLLTNTKKYHAGSRFDYLTGYLQDFTAENLQNAIAEAMIAEEKNNGVKLVDFATQKKTYEVKHKSYEELKQEIEKIAKQLSKEERMEEYRAVTDEHLGKGKGVKDTDASQTQVLELILADLKELATN